MNPTLLLIATALALAVLAGAAFDVEATQPATLAAPMAARIEDGAAAVFALAASREAASDRQFAEPAPLADAFATAATAHEEWMSLLATMQAGDTDMHVVVGLRDLLCRHPELAATFADLARTAQLEERIATRLVQALERSGDGPCQAALATIADAPNAAASVREQAVRSLGDVPLPTPATFAALWTLAHAADGQAADAMLAFGRATAKVQATDAVQHDLRCREIQQELRRSTAPPRSRVLLNALAAAGYAAIAVEAVDQLGAADPGVRAAAVYVLLDCEGPHVEAIAQDLLRVEHDPEVRRIVVRGLRLRSQT